MPEAQTVPVKYLFLDVVGFTHKRSVEAQSDIVSILNTIVDSSVTANGIDRDKVIFLPTGDGICIGLLNIEDPYDIHMRLALSIIEAIGEHNSKTNDLMRNFEVRIGLNANTDNLVIDINGKPNLAGAGINIAARIMGKADGNQILISENVHETLQYREKYLQAFNGFDSVAKHGLRLRVYQFAEEGRAGLNVDVPSEFRKNPIQEEHLTAFAAYYMAHAASLREFLLSKITPGQSKYSLTTMLYFLAMDSMGNARATEIDPYSPWVFGDGKLGLAEVFNYYQSVDFRVISGLCSIPKEELAPYSTFFEGHLLTPSDYLFVNERGINKLKNEFPNVYAEFELETKRGTNRS